MGEPERAALSPPAPQVMRVGEQALLPHMGSTVELILVLGEEDKLAQSV